MLGPLLDLLAPPGCVACRAPLAGAAAAPLCGACRRALRFLHAEAPCPRCGLPRAGAGAAAGGHARCPARGAAWRAAWAPVAYAGPATGLVAALKFRGALPCAQLMAAQIAAGAPPGLLGAGTVLVPVPTHPARARRRGYDQARVLADALAGRTGLPVARCLRRTGSRARQLGAGREERLRAGRLELRCHGPAPERAALVDDVHTTGATLRAAALALCAAGASDVVAITWARTL
jgi:predicted amidophosphoribosyltransferase